MWSLEEIRKQGHQLIDRIIDHNKNLGNLKATQVSKTQECDYLKISSNDTDISEVFEYLNREIYPK